MKRWQTAFLFIAVIAAWAYGFCNSTWMGSLDTLFGGLAFVGLILTIILQQKELKDNTQALVDQKNEMAKQWTEMEKQNVNAKRQRFEATLFNMWNIHFETRNLMENKGRSGILAFKEYIDHVISYSKEYFKTKYPDSGLRNSIYSSCLLSGLHDANANTEFLTIMEPYLNSLKLIYDSIKQAELNEGAEARYLNLMQSYLTNFEVMFLVLHYNYLLSKGRESSLTQMYKDLNVTRYFAFRLKENYQLELHIDSGLV
jgi:hypothetical protein